MGQYGAGMMFQTLQPNLHTCMSKNQELGLLRVCLFWFDKPFNVKGSTENSLEL